MKRLTFTIIILLFILSPWLVFATTPPPTGTDPAEAENQQYQLIENIGLLSKGDTVTLAVYLQTAFRWGFGIITALSVMMLVLAGVEYSAIGVSEGLKSSAKKRIENVFTGLAILLTSFLLLNTINPKLTTFELTLPPIEFNSKSNEPDPGFVMGSGRGAAGEGERPSNTSESADENGMRQLFLGDPAVAPNTYGPNGIGINNPPCRGSVGTGCTSLAGMPMATMNRIKDVQSACTSWVETQRGTRDSSTMCRVMITGGTEPGHKSHGPGREAIDLRLGGALDNYVKVNSTSHFQYGGYPLYVVPSGSGVSTFWQEGDHWHVRTDGKLPNGTPVP